MVWSLMSPNTTGDCDPAHHMKVISVRERTVDLASATANAAISFDTMTASAVAVEVETARGRFHGLGFSSIGRFAHGGLLRERFIPRLLNAASADFLDLEGTFSMNRAWAILMTNEKEGGHGERSGAVGVLETALWDAWAKSLELPLWTLLQQQFGHSQSNGLQSGQTPIYASGGHYHTHEDGDDRLRREVCDALAQGYGWFKLKIGGASDAVDMQRLETAIQAAGTSQSVAADANYAFDHLDKKKTLRDLDQLALRWIEEPVKPLNYHGLAAAKNLVATPLATGENIFSSADAANLLHFGGLQPGQDKLQIDPVLSYGITEYMRMIKSAESAGWSRSDFVPHAGHQTALHLCAGLGLGAHETASLPGPFGGVSDDTKIENGVALLGDAPGAGIENKPALYRYFDGLTN